MSSQELTVGAFCIHKTKWGARGCVVVAFHNNSVVIKYAGGGYHGVPAKSLAITTKAKALSAERNHYAGMKRG